MLVVVKILPLKAAIKIFFCASTSISNIFGEIARPDADDLNLKNSTRLRKSSFESFSDVRVG